MRYVIVGATFSGNKGAASMLEASIQTITKKDSSAEFSVLSVYPKEDGKFNHYPNVEIIPLKPLFLGLVINPLSLLYKFFSPLRSLLRRQRHIKLIAESDVFLDQGGITFVDGRAKFLIYNVATILPPLLMGTRVVKCSQAMGPFETVINKNISKIILPYIDTICARGDITHRYLKDLKLSNVIKATDYAFLMDISDKEARRGSSIIKKYNLYRKEAQTVVVMPSEVVRKKTESTGQNYVKYNLEFIKFLLSHDYHVLLLAYSARGGTDSRHNNDLPVCRDIAAGIDHDKFTFIDKELSAQVLRYIIGKADVTVVSRFHAMVAALSMSTPPLVIGWSHKYAEIMSMFGLGKATMDSKYLDQAILQKTFSEFITEKVKYEHQIHENLKNVKENAYKQVDAIVK